MQHMQHPNLSCTHHFDDAIAQHALEAPLSKNCHWNAAEGGQRFFPPERVTLGDETAFCSSSETCCRTCTFHFTCHTALQAVPAHQVVSWAQMIRYWVASAGKHLICALYLETVRPVLTVTLSMSGNAQTSESFFGESLRLRGVGALRACEVAALSSRICLARSSRSFFLRAQSLAAALLRCAVPLFMAHTVICSLAGCIQLPKG